MGGLVILFSKQNTTPFVSLDNLSTITISDFYAAHSSFHPIDLNNGLKLSPALPLCPFSVSFAVGEDDILAFYFDVLLLKFWSPKDFYVKNMIFVKDYIESSKSGTVATVPDFSKLKIDNKASF